MPTILNNSNSIANQFIAELRNAEIQNDRLRFRRNLERLGEIMAYEVSKSLDYEPMEVETPLGTAVEELPTSRIILATILRAGLPFHQGFLNYFDAAENAFVAAYRQHHKDGSFEIAMDYVTTPDLEDCTLILCDPMIATGASMNLTLQTLKRYGTPKTVHICSIISSSLGLETVRRENPKAKIWLGALDEELTAKSYIVPGLGDAGDLAFGAKG